MTKQPYYLEMRVLSKNGWAVLTLGKDDDRALPFTPFTGMYFEVERWEGQSDERRVVRAIWNGDYDAWRLVLETWDMVTELGEDSCPCNEGDGCCS